MKVFVLGFMGCGKSTIGKRLAAYLGYEFLDLDKVIEEERYTIDADGIRTDYPPESWVADIEFVTPDEILMKHPTQGKIGFRREDR